MPLGPHLFSSVTANYVSQPRMSGFWRSRIRNRSVLRSKSRSVLGYCGAVWLQRLEAAMVFRHRVVYALFVFRKSDFCNFFSNFWSRFWAQTLQFVTVMWRFLRVVLCATRLEVFQVAKRVSSIAHSAHYFPLFIGGRIGDQTSIT